MGEAFERRGSSPSESPSCWQSPSPQGTGEGVIITGTSPAAMAANQHALMEPSLSVLTAQHPLSVVVEEVVDVLDGRLVVTPPKNPPRNPLKILLKKTMAMAMTMTMAMPMTMIMTMTITLAMTMTMTMTMTWAMTTDLDVTEGLHEVALMDLEHTNLYR